MQKTNISPEILQPFFECAANAADKGQSQFFTPLELGRQLAQSLPRHRPVLVDLNCGAGHLLQASARDQSLLLGADIDPCRGQTVEGATHQLSRITSDAGLLHAWLKEVGFRADCLVLNPPWRLFFYRARLAALLESQVPAVRAAFQGVESGIPADTIDSTIAMALIFRRGQQYPLRSETVSFTRKVLRPNSFTGLDEELEYHGQELAFMLTTPGENEWSFMEATLRDDPGTKVGNAKRVKGNGNRTKAIDFTLQELVAHFAIPEVPDVAAAQPAAYAGMLERLSELETICGMAAA